MNPSDYLERAGTWDHALRMWAGLRHGTQLCMCSGRWPTCPHPEGQDVARPWVGRCRSGKRWFWTVRDYRYGRRERAEIDIQIHGVADTEAEALDAIGSALLRHLDGDPARVLCSAGTASDRLKEINEAQRAERVAAKPRSEDTSAAPVEYLHSLDLRSSDAYWVPDEWRRRTYRITRKTKNRVYYEKDFGRGEGFVDRAALERDGKVDLRHEYVGQAGRTLYLRLPALPDQRVNSPNLSELRRLMADLHPDRAHDGYDPVAYQAARSRYLRAKAGAAS